MARPEDPTARARILAAASQLFYERGVTAVGIADVVAVAGTGRNVLYRHFPGRQELVMAYLADVADRMDASLAEKLEGRAPAAALVALAQHVAELVSRPDYRGCPFRNYLRETRDTEEAPGQFALGRVHGLRRRIEELAGGLEVADAGGLAEQIWLILEGVYAAAVYPGSADVGSGAVRQIDNLVAAAIQGTGATGR